MTPTSPREPRGTGGVWGRGDQYLRDGLFVVTVQLDFLEHFQEILRPHPKSVGKMPSVSPANSAP